MKKLLIVLVIAIVVFTYGTAAYALESKQTEEEYSGYISIPGITKLVFSANKEEQDVSKVDFYNPEKNQCNIVYKLILDNGVVIWEGKPLQPGYHFQKIKLEKTLPVGQYTGVLQAKCYDWVGNPLNGCTFEVKIKVE